MAGNRFWGNNNEISTLYASWRSCASSTRTALRPGYNEEAKSRGETGERLIKQDLNTDQQGAWPEQKLWSSSGDMWAVEDGRPYSPSAYEAELHQF